MFGAADAFASFAASQAETLAKIRAGVPDLAEKPDFTWAAGGGHAVGGAPATLLAFDAPGASNVAWLSALDVEGTMSSLTVYNGPLTDVPHLASRVALTSSGDFLTIFLDWRPRAYGAYEMVREDGTYPGPEELGRDAFAYSGARKTFETKFYTAELQAVVDELLGALEGAAPPAAAVGELDQLTRGPLCVSVTAPLSEANVAAVAAARAKAADAWLAWQADDGNAHTPGAPVNTQYVFDSKAKQNMYGALLGVLQDRFGDEGVGLTAADSGPLDEGYVGGGS